MKATAFSPAHITGFFEPCFDQTNLKKSGSRGAGFNLSLGALSTVELQPSLKQNITISINGKKDSAPVTTLGVKQLLGSQAFNVSVDIWLDLPIGQGFGMSAAGTLSSCLALSSLLNLSENDAVIASHLAEVSCSTGLGDVVAQQFGGIEIRREPGLPPYGYLEHIPGSYDIVLCIVGEHVLTSNILLDVKQIENITMQGRECLQCLLQKPSFTNLLVQSQLFSKKTHLASELLLDAIDACEPYGKVSMCMLGNSLFAVGNQTQLVDILSKYGNTYCCRIETRGAHILKK